jgi:hypothetical protein
MEETRFYQQPWFYIVSRAAGMLVLYGIAVGKQWLDARAAGGIFNPFAVVGDILLLIFLLVFWLAFFAQFVLPVQTFGERQKIFDRLMGYLGGSRGPAIFIKNGQAVDRPGESERKGAGVLWLDSASAAVTHVDVSFKNTFGPGVHFTVGGEKIAATVSLHPQSQNIGPNEKDRPFGPQGDASEDEFKEMQKRRMMTSALTRDGIEVVPTISVSFKIDADAVQGDNPGSHFGYREEPVSKAIINQAVNPNAKPRTLEYNVDWNELPAYVAADLWREFISKFRLMQLFDSNCALPAAIPMESPLPPGQDTEALGRPMAGRDDSPFAKALTEMLHETNRWLEKLADLCEKGGTKKTSKSAAADNGARPGGGGKPPDTSRKTALQVINFLLKERMTNPRAPMLNQNGEPQRGWQESREYKLLKERGIRITSVNVSNLRFPPKVEEQLISQWTANWLDNARKERDRIELARSYATLSGQEKAMIGYTTDMAYSVLESKREAKGLKETVKSLLSRSRMLLVRSDRMHRRASNELQELEDILQWLESNQT